MAGYEPWGACRGDAEWEQPAFAIAATCAWERGRGGGWARRGTQRQHADGGTFQAECAREKAREGLGQSRVGLGERETVVTPVWGAGGGLGVGEILSASVRYLAAAFPLPET